MWSGKPSGQLNLTKANDNNSAKKNYCELSGSIKQVY